MLPENQDAVRVHQQIILYYGWSVELFLHSDKSRASQQQQHAAIIDRMDDCGYKLDISLLLIKSTTTVLIHELQDYAIAHFPGRHSLLITTNY